MNLDRLITEILVFLNYLLDIFKKAERDRKEREAQDDAKLAESDPSAAFNRHFGGM